MKNMQKSKTIATYSTNTKKRYFQGLKISKEKPIKAKLFKNEKEKEKEKNNGPISLKTIMNKSNIKIVSTFLYFWNLKI